MAFGEAEDSGEAAELPVAAFVAKTVPAVAPTRVDINCLRFMSLPLFPNCLVKRYPTNQITRTMSKEHDVRPAITGSLPVPGLVPVIVIPAGVVPALGDAVGVVCIENPAAY